jgi:hypothetical protein
VTTRQASGGHLVTLTPEGRAELDEPSARLRDPFANFGDAPSRPDLRELHLIWPEGRGCGRVSPGCAVVGACARFTAS